MMVSPDQIFNTKAAAEYLKVSQRQVQRMLADGQLRGVSQNGHWRIPAVNLWQYLRIEDEMTAIWLKLCSKIQTEPARR